MIPYARQIGAAVALAALCGWTWLVWDYASSKADVALAEAKAEAAEARATLADERTAFSEDAREREHDKAEELAAIADQHEQDKADAIAAKDRTIADLAAGTLELRDHWAGCETARVSEAATGGGQPDAGTRLRAESAGRIVQAVAECQAQVKGLQAVVRADRAMQP